MKLLVNEIFNSIQGEGIDLGRPCVMVRLTGCNLNCSYCDTGYAFEEGQYFTLDEIINKVKSFGSRIVEITGGEPLAQENTPELIKKLLDLNYRTLIETNGSFNIDKIDSRAVKIVDIKTPSSRMDKFNLYSNINKLNYEDQLKFVIGNRNDFDFAVAVLNEVNPKIKGGNIIFSPVFDKIDLKELSSWIIEENLNIRMQVQLHKIIWPHDMRGV